MIDIKILFVSIIIVFGLFLLYKYFIKESIDDDTDDYDTNNEINNDNDNDNEDVMSEPKYDLDDLQVNEPSNENKIIYRRKLN